MGRGRPQGHGLSDATRTRIRNSMEKYWGGPEGQERAAAMRFAVGDIDYAEYLSGIAGLSQSQRLALLADGSQERARQSLAGRGPTGRALAANAGYITDSEARQAQRVLRDYVPLLAVLVEAMRIQEGKA